MNTKFSDAILKRKMQGFIPVIPDIKQISPKEGDILKGRDPAVMAKILIEAGAPALSVVTENKYFGGSAELLKKVSETAGSNIPVLQKDFITSADQLKTAKADAVLLICAIQSFPMIKELYKKALKIGLEPLIEVHTKEELFPALGAGAKLIGINNRDIVELEKDDGTVDLTGKLAKYIPENVTIISESSIKTPQDAEEAIRSGADAVLVGTALWQSENIFDFYNSLSSRIDVKTRIIR